MKKTLLLILVLVFLTAGCSNWVKPSTIPDNTISAAPEKALPETTTQALLPTVPPESTQPPTGEADTALAAYKAVLKNQLEFYSTENKKNVLFGDFLTNQEIFGVNFTSERFAILDMDGDNIPEVVIELLEGDFNEVFHYHDGGIDGYIYSNRQLGQLKADGTFTWAGSAGYWGYGKLNFESIDEYKTEKIGYVNIDNGESEVYYIDDQTVTEDEFNAFVDEQDAKPDAAWHAFSQESIDAAF